MTGIKTNLDRLINVVEIKMRDKGKTVEDLFLLYKNESTDTINMEKFLAVVEKTGIRRTDPRLKELMEELEELQSVIGQKETPIENNNLPFDLFQRLVDKNLVLLSQALRKKLAVPEFEDFCTRLREIFTNCRSNNKVQIQYCFHFNDFLSHFIFKYCYCKKV